MTELAKPLPDVHDPLTAPFWAGTRESRLLLPHCPNCGYLQWPPEVVCPECKHTEKEWSEYPAHGSLWSYAVYYRAFDPAFADDIPYTVGLIELDVGRKMYGIMVGEEAEFQIGQPVSGVFDSINDEVTFLEWRMDTSA